MAPAPANLLSVVQDQGRRIAKLEREVTALKRGATQEEYEEPVNSSAKASKETEPSGPMFPDISMTTVITTLGVIGVVIGLISFFSFAIANEWIGPMAQIFIGVLVGLALFVVGYVLYAKHSAWSITSFGGAIFIEYLSIGYGVWGYEIIAPDIAFAALLLFLAIGMLISIKYDSLFIGFWAMIGGFIIPPLSGANANPLMTFGFLLALSIAIMVVSYYKDWGSVRIVSFLFVMGYGIWGYNSFGNQTITSGLAPLESLVFMGLFFLVYNLAPIIHSVKADTKIKAVDVVTLTINSFISAIFLYTILYENGPVVISREVLGGLYVLVAFVLLFEAFTLKKTQKLEITPTIYSVLTSGVLLMNVGIVLVFSTGSFLHFALLVLPQWALFHYLGTEDKDALLYKIYGHAAFCLFGAWWLVEMWGGQQLADATIVIVCMSVFLALLYVFVKVERSAEFCSTMLVLFGFIYSYSLLVYVQQLAAAASITLSTPGIQAVLSGIWLVYALALFVWARKDNARIGLKVIAIILLVIALIKIALYDLLQLEGIVRIAGFTVFGVMLLVGGLMLRNE